MQILLCCPIHRCYHHLVCNYSLYDNNLSRAGLVVSVWPDVYGGGSAGPISGDLLFFTATIPIAVSGVYKEIAFKSVSDMDVWYLNGYVALPQFLIGLLYAPLAAVMTGISFSHSSFVWKKKKSFSLVVVGDDTIFQY